MRTLSGGVCHEVNGISLIYQVHAVESLVLRSDLLVPRNAFTKREVVGVKASGQPPFRGPRVTRRRRVVAEAGAPPARSAKPSTGDPPSPPTRNAPFKRKSLAMLAMLAMS